MNPAFNGSEHNMEYIDGHIESDPNVGKEHLANQRAMENDRTLRDSTTSTPADIANSDDPTVTCAIDVNIEVNLLDEKEDTHLQHIAFHLVYQGVSDRKTGLDFDNF